MDFQRMIYEIVEKKTTTFVSQQAHLYMRVTDILRFLKFYFVHIVKVCFVLKKESLCSYSSEYA